MAVNANPPVSISGIDSLLKITAAIDAAPVKITAAMVKWADYAGPLFVAGLMVDAPTNKNKWDPVAVAHAGRLRDSIRYERNTSVGTVLMQFTTNVPYAPYVIQGTEPHDIFPVNRQALHWIGPYGDSFSKGVHHPGTKANNFPLKTWNRLNTGLVDSWNLMLRDVFGE